MNNIIKPNSSIICSFVGCKVLGFAGTEEKVKWITDELKFDFAFNYKEVHLDSILKKYAVEGVNCYFDNVIMIELQTCFFQAFKLLRLFSVVIEFLILSNRETYSIYYFVAPSRGNFFPKPYYIPLLDYFQGRWRSVLLGFAEHE